MPRLRLALLATSAAALAVACKGSPDDTPWCSLEPRAPKAPSVATPTYHRDVGPIIQQKCGGCHASGGIAPFPLTSYEDARGSHPLIAQVTGSHRMPPWLAASCCTPYLYDFSLTDDEKALISRWSALGAPGGDRKTAPPPRPPLGGLSRVDLTIRIPEPYLPSPPPGSTDDNRCFVMDWPLDHAMHVTGLNPVPGVRSVVHHIIVGVMPPDEADAVIHRDQQDPGPGFDCNGGLGALQGIDVLGGSLLGSDLPRGLGKRVEPGSKLVVNIHYTTENGPPSPDQTAIQLKLDPTGRDFKSIAVANPVWLASGAMKIEAGEKDATFWYRYAPRALTKNKRVYLQSVTPHMHYFGSRMVTRIIRKDDRRECLMEIPRWDFGWEQPFWFAEEKVLEPGDDLYVECHFDNSAENQKNGAPPRDISWGGDNQDMCLSFVAFTEEP